MNEEKKTPKTTEDLEKRFSRDGSLTRKKLFEYIPAMVITNLSTLLLISVDGLVLGNFVGSDALSAVNIFYPATMYIGLVSCFWEWGRPVRSPPAWEETMRRVCDVSKKP